MSGQQPPYGGPPPGQPPYGGSPPPYGQPPGGQPPGGQPAGGQPPGGQPPYGQPAPGPYDQPPAGWSPPGPPTDKPKQSTGAIITIVVLVLLVIGLGGLSGYLWSQDSDDSTTSSDTSSESGDSDDSGDSGSALNASTDPVKLPKKFGDYEVSSIDSYGGSQYEKEYEKALGASVDLQEYTLKDPTKATSGSASFLTVVATRAELPVVPAHGPDLNATTKFVRDDMTCWLQDYASKGTKPTPQRCMRVGDGLTVEVNAFTSGDDKNAPTVKDFAKLTDKAYEAIK